MKKKGLLLFPLIGGMMLGGCDLSNINILDLIDPLSIFHDKEIVPTKITLNFTSKEIQVGSSFSLTATVTPKDATNKKVTWSTSASNVATVSSSGLVTAVANGTATITAKTESGNLTAKCVVTVKEADPTPGPNPADKRAPEEYQGYKRVGKPEEGHEYILGYYETTTQKVKFCDGNYHEDGGKYYPFYMGTTDVISDDLAKFEVTYLEDNVHFNISVTASGVAKDGGEKPWNGKYFSVYEASSSFDNDVLSIAPVTDLSKPYKDEISPTHTDTEYKVYGDFEYIENYGDLAIFNTIGIKIAKEDQDPRVGIFGCVFAKYISLNCSDIDKTFNDDFAAAYFFEKI